ncbi:MAG: acetolactate synthase small subunit [Clostridiales bacterium]|jgi:acetolactate synthase-1/3 small subunit|nr:acetolactate synthase small subunit [Clostridiales bacterium]
MKQVVLSILVDNTAGVLSRVSGLFSRRGYNITSLTVGETQDPSISRITVVVKGDNQIIDQIKKQLAKLEDVREIFELIPGESVIRELILVKVVSNKDNRQNIIGLADIFRAKIVDVSADSMVIELTGDDPKINAFLKLLEDFTVTELVRTGITGLARGTEDIVDYLGD